MSSSTALLPVFGSEPTVHLSARPAAQEIPRILLPLPPQGWDDRHTQAHTGDLNSGPYVCTVRPLLPESPFSPLIINLDPI